MTTPKLEACSYRVLRYTPNLVRDEWVNIGVVLHDLAANRLRFRVLTGQPELRRVRRLHPNADLALLQGLSRDLEDQLQSANGNPAAFLQKLDETLSNVLQLSPQKGVLTEDIEGELERLYRDLVEVPSYRRVAGAERTWTRSDLRIRARQVFRRAGILDRMITNVTVEEYTEKGDPFRMDFAYRRNGTRGFLHALTLAGDPAVAKVLAYTAERIRARIAQSEFFAITEAEPDPADQRQQFVARLLAGQSIGIVPVAGLEGFAHGLRSSWM